MEDGAEGSYAGCVLSEAQGVEFDEGRVAAREPMNRTTSMIGWVHRIRDVLALEPGEHVLSIGASPALALPGLAEDGR